MDVSECKQMNTLPSPTREPDPVLLKSHLATLQGGRSCLFFTLDFILIGVKYDVLECTPKLHI